MRGVTRRRGPEGRPSLGGRAGSIIAHASTRPLRASTRGETMGEYQYHEFVTVDRPLTSAEQAELRAISEVGDGWM